MRALNWDKLDLFFRKQNCCLFIIIIQTNKGVIQEPQGLLKELV